MKIKEENAEHINKIAQLYTGLSLTRFIFPIN